MGFFNWLKGLFSKLLKVFKSFVDVAVPLIYQVAIAQLKPFAISVVEKLNYENISNSEKRNQAMVKIKAEAKSSLGRDLPENILRIIVEIALGYIKAIK